MEFKNLSDVHNIKLGMQITSIIRTVAVYLPHLQNLSFFVALPLLFVHDDGTVVYTRQCYYTYHFSWWPRRPLGSLERESKKKGDSSDNYKILKKAIEKNKNLNNKPGLPFLPSVQLVPGCPVIRVRKTTQQFEKAVAAITAQF